MEFGLPVSLLSYWQPVNVKFPSYIPKTFAVIVGFYEARKLSFIIDIINFDSLHTHSSEVA